MKKVLIFIVVFYFLALLQASFFVHFSLFGWTPNFILIFALLLIFLEKPQKIEAMYGAAILGFFWDVFSNDPLGFHMAILAVLAIFLKLILRNYIQPVVRFPRLYHYG